MPGALIEQGQLMNVLLVVVTAWIKDSARPEYWEADKDVVACGVCSTSFVESKQTIHHCRACGKGVCDDCSQNKRPVPSRGWNSPVRVCNTCKENPSL